MADAETLTVTLPADLAALVRGAVEGGQYGSSSEVVGQALRDWQAKRAAQQAALESLRAEIAVGLADEAAGRIVDFDTDRIIERGRKLLAERSRSG
jgi:antitoxin ParD1/3/4